MESHDEGFRLQMHETAARPDSTSLQFADHDQLVAFADFVQRMYQSHTRSMQTVMVRVFRACENCKSTGDDFLRSNCPVCHGERWATVMMPMADVMETVAQSIWRSIKEGMEQMLGKPAAITLVGGKPVQEGM